MIAFCSRLEPFDSMVSLQFQNDVLIRHLNSKPNTLSEVEQGILAVCYVPALPRWHDRIRARTASLRNHAVSKVLRF
eukprot:m.11318 g.11318  ORF g.11318 m.11318 type:complete len:77 (+) comp9787_c0_seq2:398-628(+)